MRLADCFEKKNHLDLAVKQASNAAEDFPQLNSDRAKEITFRLGELHEKRGAKEDARREYTKIYEVDISYREEGANHEGLGSLLVTPAPSTAPVARPLSPTDPKRPERT
jgi:hypothetical protein